MSGRGSNLPPSVEKEDLSQTKLRSILFGLHVPNAQVKGHQNHTVSITLFPVSFVRFPMLCSCGFVSNVLTSPVGLG